MKKVIKWILVGIITTSLLFIGLFIIPYFTNTLMPWQKTDAIETALQWGGLSELPKQTKYINVDTEGNMFSRAFYFEFNLSQEELTEWISNSKRLNEQVPITNHDGTKLYKIYPGEGGSVGGTVRIDFKSGNVKVYMAWS